MMIFIVSRLLREKFVFGKLFENLSYRYLLFGAACGTLCVAVGFLLIYAFGQMTISKMPIRWDFILSSFVMIAFSATAEELFFRGFVQNLLTKIIKPIMAVFFTSIIFILFHILNPDLSFLSAFNIFLAGLVFGFSYLITKNLMFPIGFHIFFNCSQSYLGFNISGEQMPSLFELIFPTANIINGGTFGFEGSIFCTLILSGLSIFFFFKIKKSGFLNKIRN